MVRESDYMHDIATFKMGKGASLVVQWLSVHLCSVERELLLWSGNTGTLCVAPSL